MQDKLKSAMRRMRETIVASLGEFCFRPGHPKLYLSLKAADLKKFRRQHPTFVKLQVMRPATFRRQFLGSFSPDLQSRERREVECTRGQAGRIQAQAEVRPDTGAVRRARASG